MDYKVKISKHLKIEGLTREEIYELLTPTANIKMGDYSMPCFSLAKVMRKAPKTIAEDIVVGIKKTEWLPKIEAVNGYINFYLNRELVANEVLERVLMYGEDFAKSKEGNGKTILLDYSSVNIAKQMHIGHLSTTALGNALKNIYSHLGYKTVGINYLGDYGSQFGDIIAYHKLFGSKEELKNGGIDYIQKVYGKSKELRAEDDDFLQKSKEWFLKIENKDKEAIELFEEIKEITLNDVKPLFKLLKMEFDEWKGELYYSDKMEPVIKELKDKGLMVESQGAQIVNLEADDLGVALILKSDGSTIYTTRDLAAAIDRYNTHKFHKVLYVTSYDQNLHFAQFFKILEKLGYEWAKGLVHVSYGRVSLPDGKLSSRLGAKGLLKDVFNNAINKSLETIEAKNPNLKNKQEVAEAVGVGAVTYGALANAKIKDIVFNMEEALSFEGETAPYMQYTYARCSSVLRKHKEMFSHNTTDADYSAINSDEAFEIIKTINNLNNTIKASAEKYEPSILSRAVMNVCKNFNKFYHEYKIIDSDAGVTSARIALTKATRISIEVGLNLLGIQIVEEM